jgi:hypothetical protein
MDFCLDSAACHTALMSDKLEIGSRLSWVVAWSLAAVAIALSLIWPSAVVWWISLLLLTPLVGLAAWRQEKKGYADETYSVGDSGPWGPPPSS